MIGDITPDHYASILRMNAEFVHWLSPLDQDALSYVLSRADYARQIDEAAGVLIGYGHDVDYPNHWNIEWLREQLDDFFYIDRIIIDGSAQGRGLGPKFYTDIESFARQRGHCWLACEVNTIPNNPVSHRFHLRVGFEAIGERSFPEKGTAVRYYAKALN